MKRFYISTFLLFSLLVVMEILIPISILNLDILYIRLWRLLLGIYAGMVLGLTGVLIQTITGNPLMDPYLCGISSGAAFGSVLFMVLSISSGIYLLLSSLGGGFFAFVILFLFLKFFRTGKNLVIVLAGVSLGFLFSSLTIITMILGNISWSRIAYTLFGSINRPMTHTRIHVFAILGILSLPFILFSLLKWKELNILLLGDESAASLGVNVERLREEILVVVAFLVGVSVTFTGIIGFIGIMAPHIARRLIGGDHRMLIPSSMILGVILTLISDVIARHLFYVQMPITTISSLLGVPFFLYLLLRREGWSF